MRKAFSESVFKKRQNKYIRLTNILSERIFRVQYGMFEEQAQR